MASTREIIEILKETKLTEDDLDFMWEFCRVFNHPVISVLGEDWRILRKDLILQIPGVYKSFSIIVLTES